MDYVVEWCSLLTGYSSQTPKMSLTYAKALVDSDRVNHMGIIKSWIVRIDPVTNAKTRVYF